MNENENMFELNEDGEISYSGIVSDDNNLFGVDEIEESEIVENGNNVDTVIDSGNLIADEIQDSEDLEEDETKISEDVDNSGSADSPLYVELSDELTEALISASTPAGGSLASGTVDYFDRIVGGLPSGYVYVAYRTDTDYSYNGVLYYGKSYTVNGDTVTFGDGARQVRVERSGSNYNTYTTYKEYSADDVVINLSRSGDVVYYSNASIGYPLLGGYDKPVDIGICLSVGLVVAFAVAVLFKIIKR